MPRQLTRSPSMGMNYVEKSLQDVIAARNHRRTRVGLTNGSKLASKTAKYDEIASGVSTHGQVNDICRRGTSRKPPLVKYWKWMTA
uniref:Uncharacterized protein n=1 Tax=Angiostrongylus cantonensis TaxID=6313 RepID=A0A0K0DQQ1_ANGCA